MVESGMRTIAVALLFCTACMMGGTSKTTTFRDTVHRYNDEVRWARLSRAVDFVAPDARVEFLKKHAKIGEQIRVSDVEIKALQLDGDKEDGVVMIQFRWIDENSLLERTSMIEQHWKSFGSAYLLVSESVAGGSNEIFVDEVAPNAK